MEGWRTIGFAGPEADLVQSSKLDRVLEAGSKRYSGDPISRSINSAIRIFFGKPYPVNEGAQRRSWDYRTRKELQLLNGLRNRYRKDGDYLNSEAVEEQIKAVEDLRKKHLGLTKI